MNKEFIPYKQALELKELGFDEECMGGYDLEDNSLYIGYISDYGIQYNPEYYTPAPLYQQAFRWFREKYNMLSTVYSNASGFLYEWSDTIGGTHRGWSECEGPNNGGVWDTYEEAELACLKKLIEIVKNK